MRRTSRLSLILLGILLALFASPIHAQKLLADGIRDLSDQVTAKVTKERKQRLAIVPLRELSGQPTLLGAYLSEELTTALVQAGSFQVVERSQLDRILAELKLDRSGLMDAESAKKVGRFLGADAILTGTITELSTYVGINCRIIDGLTGEIRGAAGVKIVKDADLNKIMSTMSPEGDVSDRRLAPGPTQVTSPSKNSFREVVNGFAFELKSCSASGNTVSCELRVTSQEVDRTIDLYSSGGYFSRLVDVDGNETRASEINLGVSGGRVARSTLIAGIATKGRVTFLGVAEASMASVIEINGAFRYDHFSVQFRNVPIQRK